MKSIPSNKPSKSSSSSTNKDTSSSSSSSLVYLEAIHIFALANLLRRPIIVVSFDFLKDIQPIFLKGIYLPILQRSEICVKNPIILAYHNFHFLPLLTALDDDSLISYEIQNNEKYFHFENIQLINKFGQDEYEKAVKPKYNDSYLRKKSDKFYNFFPLVTSNFEQIPILFSKEEEKSNSEKYLKEYLQTRIIEIDLNDPKSFNKNYLTEFDTIQVLCCEISRKITSFPQDGIENYLTFLNDTIKNSNTKSYKNQYPIKNSPSSSRDLDSFERDDYIESTYREPVISNRKSPVPQINQSKTRIEQSHQENITRIEVGKKEPEDELNESTKNSKNDMCIIKSCENSRLKDEKYRGLCTDCYNDLLHRSKQTINSNNYCKIKNCPNPRTEDEKYHGYCVSCFTNLVNQQRQNVNLVEYCKNRECSNLRIPDSKYLGLCIKCYQDVSSEPKQLTTPEDYCRITSCGSLRLKEEKYRGLCFNCYRVSAIQANKVTNLDNLCKNKHCSNQRIGDEPFRGYCSNCFKDYLDLTNASNSSTNTSTKSIDARNFSGDLSTSGGHENIMAVTDKLKICEPEYKTNLCKNEECSIKIKLQDTYNGYCNDCYKKIFRTDTRANNNLKNKQLVVIVKHDEDQVNKDHTTTKRYDATEYTDQYGAVNTKSLNNNNIRTIQTKNKLCKNPRCMELIQSSSINMNNNDYCNKCMKSLSFEKLKTINNPDRNGVELPIANNYQSAYNNSPTSFTPTSKLYNNEAFKKKETVLRLNSEQYDNLAKPNGYTNTNTDSIYQPYFCKRCYRPSKNFTCTNCYQYNYSL